MGTGTSDGGTGSRHLEFDEVRDIYTDSTLIITS